MQWTTFLCGWRWKFGFILRHLGISWVKYFIWTFLFNNEETPNPQPDEVLYFLITLTVVPQKLSSDYNLDWCKVWFLGYLLKCPKNLDWLFHSSIFSFCFGFLRERDKRKKESLLVVWERSSLWERKNIPLFYCFLMVTVVDSFKTPQNCSPFSFVGLDQINLLEHPNLIPTRMVQSGSQHTTKRDWITSEKMEFSVEEADIL